ncbi:hypothetical protein J7T55_007747 [Diaporthe amygdali]|uniref:uncharacterized protein n=1 Tax=Phomopsis amygdali TaxID=1214568 RepID=UPI0022FECFDC|nr:uncharacterized protein J7T55_007747 [Diaporthe amygdali]KAJ0107557.1 hypothetical protein J7T55_007747 [Diaporthe amygdali]
MFNMPPEIVIATQSQHQIYRDTRSGQHPQTGISPTSIVDVLFHKSKMSPRWNVGVIDSEITQTMGTRESVTRQSVFHIMNVDAKGVESLRAHSDLPTGKTGAVLWGSERQLVKPALNATSQTEPGPKGHLFEAYKEISIMLYVGYFEALPLKRQSNHVEGLRGRGH